MAEATQPVEPGEHPAITTPPMHTQPRRTGRGRAMLLVALLLLGGGVGTIAWQHLDTHPEEMQPVTPAVSPLTDVAVVNEQQLQHVDHRTSARAARDRRTGYHGQSEF